MRGPMTGKNSSLPPSSGPAPTREERLAAKLRENLRRRKSQARAQSESGADEHAPSGGAPVSQAENDTMRETAAISEAHTLSKSSPES